MPEPRDVTNSVLHVGDRVQLVRAISDTEKELLDRGYLLVGVITRFTKPHGYAVVDTDPFTSGSGGVWLLHPEALRKLHVKKNSAARGIFKGECWPVWPVPTPPVPWLWWTDKNIVKYSEAYRPKWYKGGYRDEEAWDRAVAKREEAYRDEQYAKYGMVRGPTGDFVKKNPSARMASLTFGVVPAFDAFKKHVTTWKNESGEGIKPSEKPVFQLEIRGVEAECGKEAAQDIPGVHLSSAPRHARSFTVDFMKIQIDDIAALWAFVNALVHHADDADQEGDEKLGDAYRDLASGIMFTLGYEWV